MWQLSNRTWMKSFFGPSVIEQIYHRFLLKLLECKGSDSFPASAFMHALVCSKHVLSVHDEVVYRSYDALCLQQTGVSAAVRTLFTGSLWLCHKSQHFQTVLAIHISS